MQSKHNQAAFLRLLPHFYADGFWPKLQSKRRPVEARGSQRARMLDESFVTCRKTQNRARGNKARGVEHFTRAQSGGGGAACKFVRGSA